MYDSFFLIERFFIYPRSPIPNHRLAGHHADATGFDADGLELEVAFLGIETRYRHNGLDFVGMTLSYKGLTCAIKSSQVFGGLPFSIIFLNVAYASVFEPRARFESESFT